MNVFEAVKQSITTRQAAEFYGFRVNRAGMIACPFHNDRTPSMKVDKRFHCFGCGADGDAVDFVSRLFELPSKEAAMKLADDFGIAYDRNGKPSIVAKSESLPPNRSLKRRKNGAFVCCPITSISSERGKRTTHRSSRRTNGIRYLQKPCRDGTISNICLTPCSTERLKIERHL